MFFLINKVPESRSCVPSKTRSASSNDLRAPLTVCSRAMTVPETLRQLRTSSGGLRGIVAPWVPPCSSEPRHASDLSLRARRSRMPSALPYKLARSRAMQAAKRQRFVLPPRRPPAAGCGGRQLRAGAPSRDSHRNRFLASLGRLAESLLRAGAVQQSFFEHQPVGSPLRCSGSTSEPVASDLFPLGRRG